MGTAIVPLCQHRMNNAALCRCPAMREQRYCYSHQRKHEQDARKNEQRARKSSLAPSSPDQRSLDPSSLDPSSLDQSWFESVPLDNALSVQRALRKVIERLLTGQVDHKKAGQMLYKLQTASVNLRSAAK